MKKMMMTLVALLTMTAAMAQDNNQCANNKKDCCKDKKECCMKDGKDMKAPKALTVEQRTEMTAKRLNLSDEQKAKLLKANKEYDETLKKILTEEQYKKLNQKPLRPGHHGGRHHGIKPPKGSQEAAVQKQD